MKVITLIEDTPEEMECDFEHGLALYIEIQQYKLLFDTGATGRFVENAAKLCTKKGNALISGCAHCGIINILEAYKKKFANEPMVVISGFHMFKNGGYTKEEIANIESIAKKLNKMYTIFYTGHCTGDKAYEIMHKIMKDKLKAIHTGKIVEIKE